MTIGSFALAGSARADTAVTVPLAEVGKEMWAGGASNGNLGKNMDVAGDVNGDGIADLVTSHGGADPVSTPLGVWVLFTHPEASTVPDLTDLDPSLGYRIRVTNAAFSITGYGAIGDQNGDDVPDFFVRQGVSDRYVVYGVADPAADLPKCDPGGTSETRCLDLSGPANPITDLNGARTGYLVSSGLSGDDFGGTQAGGDFDGDGKDELAIGATGTDVIDGERGAIYVARHDLGDLCPAMPSPCQLSFSALSTDDVIRIDGPAANTTFGRELKLAGDLNGDGQEDLLTTVGATGPETMTVYAIYGKDWQTSPVGTEGFGPPNGFKLAAPGGTLALAPGAAGDVNGDGRDDLAALVGSALYTNGWKLGLAYTPATASATAVPLDPPLAGQGFLVASSATERVGQSGHPMGSVGDLNADGFGEIVASMSTAAALGVNGAGAARVYLGAQDPPSEELQVGPSLTAEYGFSLVGQAGLTGVGGGVANLGDVDQDGIPDLFVAATTGTGRIFMVPGRNLFGNAITGLTGGVLPDAAKLAGTANAHGRASDAHFEYGTTAAYGQETAGESIGQGNQTKVIEADLSGLDADTTYHYRLVVENDLGLKSYGQDRTFKTAAEPVERCESDETLPGCPKYDGKKFCQTYPSDPVCQPKPPEPTVARLSGLIANVKASKVRRGGKTVVWAWITSTGTKSADGVKVCAKVPKKLAKVAGKSCRNVGSLASGATGKVKFTVKVKRKARKKAKVNLKLIASATDLPNENAKVRFAVK